MPKDTEASPLRTALMMSLADVFMGASGLVLALIVLASTEEDPRIARIADEVVRCTGAAPDWTVSSEGTAAQSLDAFISTMSEREQFLIRLGVETSPDMMRCFDQLQRAVRKHNRALAERGNVGAALSVIWLPAEGVE